MQSDEKNDSAVSSFLGVDDPDRLIRYFHDLQSQGFDSCVVPNDVATNSDASMIGGSSNNLTYADPEVMSRFKLLSVPKPKGDGTA